MNKKLFSDHTVDVLVLELMDAMGAARLPDDKKNPIAAQLKETLEQVVASAMLESLDGESKKRFLLGVASAKDPESAMAIFKEVPDFEQKAMQALENFKKVFLADYFKRLEAKQ